MQTNANADDRAVATALGGVIVRGEQNMLAATAEPGIAGARAALETFYYAFNTRSLDLYQRIWADDPLVQLYSPVAGMIRGSIVRNHRMITERLATLYSRRTAVRKSDERTLTVLGGTVSSAAGPRRNHDSRQPVVLGLLSLNLACRRQLAV